MIPCARAMTTKCHLPPEHTPKPATRLKRSDACPHHMWDNENHPRKTSGINHWCPLSALSKFDMIWDFCPDMMHIVKVFFERLVLGVFSGKRKPTKFKPKKPEKPSRRSKGNQAEYKQATAKYKADREEYDECRATFDECKFNELAQKTVDERVQNLVGYPYWIRSSMVLTRR